MELAKLSEIFNIYYGNSLELNSLDIVNNDIEGINFVSRTSKNNGISAIVKKHKNVIPFKAGLITVAVGGSVLETFLQPKQFYTGYHVMILEPKEKITDIQKLFYCYCIKRNKYRYNYGRQANRTLKDIEIPKKTPNWVNNLKLQDYSELSEPMLINKINLTKSNWEWFRYDSLFSIERGRGPRKQDIKSGQVPFISSSDQKNGLTGYTDVEPIHIGNVISVTRNGSVAEAFYQPVPFCSTEDVHIFTPKFKMNIHIAFFLIPLIRKEKYRYSYGRKWGIGRMNESLIKLPVNKKGEPDFKFMEDYIKSLPYSKQLNQE